MRFFKYLVFIILSIISVSSFAAYSVGGDQSFSTGQAVCDAYGSGYSYYDVTPNGNIVGKCQNSWGNNTWVYQVQGSCPSFVSTKPINVPGWTDWGIDETDAYHSKIANTTVCYDGCRYKNPSMSGYEGSDLMTLDYKNPVQDSSCPKTTDKPDGIPPDGTPSAPPMQCTSDYCEQPQGNSCPAGYTTQSFNNKNYCVKDGANPPSNQNPPTNGGGDSFDAQGIINAVNNAATSIKNALSTGFTSVTNALGITNQKLDATNAKLDTSNGHLNDIKNNTTATNAKLDAANVKHDATNAKLDAANVKHDATNAKLDAANDKHDATNAKLDTSNGHLNDIKNNTNATNQKLDATNGKLDEINQNGKDGNGLLQQIKDFFTEEHELPTGSTTVPYSDIDLPDYEKDYVSWSPTCPPDVQVPIHLMGQSSTLNLSWSPICELLSKLRWAIIACAYFAAAYIILGMR
jgi:hypothetical protein